MHNLRIVFAERNGRVIGFVAYGHAGYGEEGEDIVCAAVSSAVELVCNTITDFYHVDAFVNVKENQITFRLNVSDEPSEKLLASFREHMEHVRSDYPEVRVETKED